MPDDKPTEATGNNGEPQEAQSYNEMDLDALEAEFQKTGGVIVEEPEDTPEPPDPAEEPAPEAPEAAEAAPETPPAEGSEPKEEAAPEPQEDERELMIQELNLKLQQAELSRKHQEFLTGRLAGELGHIKKQITQPRQPAPVQRQDDPYGEDTEPATERVVYQTDPALQSQVAELHRTEAERAVAEVHREFNDKVQRDLLSSGVDQTTLPEKTRELMERLAPIVQEESEPYMEMQLKGKSLQKVSRMVLDAAYLRLQMDDMAARRAKAKERKVAQVSENKQAKLAATSSGAGSAPPPKARPKTIEEMSVDELDAALTREFGDLTTRTPPRR